MGSDPPICMPAKEFRFYRRKVKAMVFAESIPNRERSFKQINDVKYGKTSAAMLGYPSFIGGKVKIESGKILFNSSIQQMVNKIELLVDQGSMEEAKQQLEAFETLVGNKHPKIKPLKTLIRFFTK